MLMDVQPKKDRISRHSCGRDTSDLTTQNNKLIGVNNNAELGGCREINIYFP